MTEHRTDELIAWLRVQAAMLQRRDELAYGAMMQQCANRLERLSREVAEPLIPSPAGVPIAGQPIMEHYLVPTKRTPMPPMQVPLTNQQVVAIYETTRPAYGMPEDSLVCLPREHVMAMCQTIEAFREALSGRAPSPPASRTRRQTPKRRGAA